MGFQKGHPKMGGMKKGQKASYTITDLMNILKKVETKVSQRSGKPFNFLEFLAEQAIKGSERLQIALLDRICPETKQVSMEHSGGMEVVHKVNLGDYGLTDADIEKHAEDLLRRRHSAIKENIN